MSVSPPVKYAVCAFDTILLPPAFISSRLLFEYALPFFVIFQPLNVYPSALNTGSVYDLSYVRFVVATLPLNTDGILVAPFLFIVVSPSAL